MGGSGGLLNIQSTPGPMWQVVGKISLLVLIKFRFFHDQQPDPLSTADRQYAVILDQTNMFNLERVESTIHFVEMCIFSNIYVYQKSAKVDYRRFWGDFVVQTVSSLLRR